MQNPWKTKSKVNPQSENGYRRISSEVYRELIAAPLTAAEYKICLFVIEKTWGYGKKFDVISASQFQEATKLAERTVRMVLAGLMERRMVYYEPSEVTVKRGSPLNRYMFNKHYDTWRFPEKCPF